MNPSRVCNWKGFLFLVFLCFPAPKACAQNQIQGQLEFAPKTNAERSAGVWIDSQYVGFVDELKGENKVSLLPGTHEVSIRLAGYQAQTLKVTVQPQKRLVVKVKLERDPKVQYSEVTAEVKLDISPARAAVFLDGAFAGHAGEFGGVGRGMLIAPGKHHIKIALAGYQSFETDVNLAANQKTEIKTDLAKETVNQTTSPTKGP